MSVAFNIIQQFQHTASKFLASQYWRPIFEVVKLSWNWNSIIQINVWEFKNSIKIEKVVHIICKPTKKSLWKYIISFVWFHFWCYFWTPRSFIWTIEFQCKLRLTTSKIGLQFCEAKKEALSTSSTLQPRMADSTNYLISGIALLLHFFTPLFLI